MCVCYMLWVLSDGRIRMVVTDDHNWTGCWTYGSWDALLTTQTFSPYARVFVYPPL